VRVWDLALEFDIYENELVHYNNGWGISHSQYTLINIKISRLPLLGGSVCHGVLRSGDYSARFRLRGRTRAPSHYAGTCT
jgi:hypothetical protein